MASPFVGLEDGFSAPVNVDANFALISMMLCLSQGILVRMVVFDL